MVVTKLDFEQIVLADPDRQLELHQGRLLEKPAMSYGHNRALGSLVIQLARQLDEDAYELRPNVGHVHYSLDNYFIPDLFVVPVAAIGALRETPTQLDVFVEPLPLVIEIWSPSTGDYDVDVKVQYYQARGDLEIWRLHPFEETLTVRRRQADGTYTNETMRGGLIKPVALSGVTIDLDKIFR
jgi:Uma2 family endonuclease